MSSGIGLGKSYPVTAAQLLPVCTGFLAPIHFFKLAKNWNQDYPVAVADSSTNLVAWPPAAHVMSSGNVTLHPLQRRSRHTESLS